MSTALITGLWAATGGLLTLVFTLRPIRGIDFSSRPYLGVLLLGIGMTSGFGMALQPRARLSLGAVLAIVGSASFVLSGLLSLWKWHRVRRASALSAAGGNIRDGKSLRRWKIFGLIYVGGFLALATSTSYGVFNPPATVLGILFLVWVGLTVAGTLTAGVIALAYFYEHYPQGTCGISALAVLAVLFFSGLIAAFLFGTYDRGSNSLVPFALFASIFLPPMVVGYYRRWGILS